MNIKRVRWSLKKLDGSEKKGVVVAPNTRIFLNHKRDVEL